MRIKMSPGRHYLSAYLHATLPSNIEEKASETVIPKLGREAMLLKETQV